MKLEEGMYVRTRNGNIEKICAIKNEYIYTDENYLSWHATYDAINKARHNMIDLIEAGDYVNGVEVAFIDELTNEIAICETDLTTRDFEGRYKFKRIKKEDVKSIVTKEKFKSMEYKVGE